MKVDESGLVQSVRARLLGAAAATNSDPNAVLVRYGIERFLYRLSISSHADRFVLKGAMLLSAWLGQDARPTRDIDLLGVGRLTSDQLRTIAREVCLVDCVADGMTFEPGSIEVVEIRTSGKYRGARLTLAGALGRARVKVQVDIGVGDATSPAPEPLEYPSLLDLPRPRLRAYRAETVVAEKVHAMVVLASANTRLKDIHDVAALSRRLDFDASTLAAAIESTFAARQTVLPAGLPASLTPGFAESPARQAQWRAFLKRSRVGPGDSPLARAVAEAAAFVEPVLSAVRVGRVTRAHWRAPGPWDETGPRPDSSQGGRP